MIFYLVEFLSSISNLQKKLNMLLFAQFILLLFISQEEQLHISIFEIAQLDTITTVTP